MPTISFLILTFNSEKFINELLDSIFQKCGAEIKSGQYELLVLDNNSKDSTTLKISEYLKSYSSITETENRKNRKPIFFLRSGNNNGYAKGINIIARYALGNILVVINPDAELIEENFEKIIEEFDKDPRLAIAGLKIVDIDGDNELTAGKFYNPLSFLLFSLGFENLAKLRFAPQKSQNVDFVSGGFIAFDKKKFQELGGYDEDYFMYVEDMDICYRAKKKKFNVKYLPFAVIKHQGQGSSSKTFATLNIYKGLLTFSSKHHSKALYFYVKYLLMLKANINIFMSLFTRNKEKAETYRKAIQEIK